MRSAAMMASLDIFVHLEPISSPAESAADRRAPPAQTALGFLRRPPHLLLPLADVIKRYARFFTKDHAGKERIEHATDESNGVGQLDGRRRHATDGREF